MVSNDRKAGIQPEVRDEFALRDSALAGDSNVKKRIG